jgi:polyisoprenoid-binding protein YceI
VSLATLGTVCAALAAASATVSAQTLSVSGSPPALVVSTAVAGAQPLAVTDATTSYTTSALLLQKKKITGQLNANMPAGVTLTIALVAPSGATSNGTVTLDNTPRDLVVNISNLIPATYPITYVLSATVSAGVIPSSSRTVTLTLVNFP